MTQPAETLVLRFYIEGSGRSWEGICVDLNIAAQGESLDEVQAMLSEMVETYLESVRQLPVDERQALLNRKSPFFLRLKIAAIFFLASLFALRRGNDKVSRISHHACPA